MYRICQKDWKTEGPDVLTKSGSDDNFGHYCVLSTLYLYPGSLQHEHVFHIFLFGSLTYIASAQERQECSLT